MIHYLQEMCPVTKKRLEKLQVLIEDLSSSGDSHRVPERIYTESQGLTPLEKGLFDAFKEPVAVDQSTVRIQSVTRDQNDILRIANGAKNEE